MNNELKKQLLRIIYMTPPKLVLRISRKKIGLFSFLNIAMIIGFILTLIINKVSLIRIVVVILLLLSLFYAIGFMIYIVINKDVLFIKSYVESLIKKDLRIVISENPIVIEENDEEVARAICFKSRRSPLDPKAILEVKQIGNSYLFYSFPALTVYQITDENKLQQLLTDKIIVERLHTKYDEKELELITDEMIQKRIDQPKDRFEKLYPILQNIWIVSMFVSCVIIFWFPGL